MGTCKCWAPHHALHQPFRVHAGSVTRHRCPLSLASMSSEQNSQIAVERRSVLALAISLTFLPRNVQAAIPTQEEYNVGSGTVIRPKQSKREARKEFKASPSSTAEAVETLKDAERLVQSFDEYAKNMAWDDVECLHIILYPATEFFLDQGRTANCPIGKPKIFKTG
eukprot:163870-Hanusia_phi.AAC.7